MTGSSPHTRGTRPQRGEGIAAERFIPAHAGNAPRSLIAGIDRTVHPRTRGERGLMWGVGFILAGSSPHTRGTRAEIPAGRRGGRFIPAHAGNAAAVLLATF